MSKIWIVSIFGAAIRVQTVIDKLVTVATILAANSPFESFSGLKVIYNPNKNQLIPCETMLVITKKFELSIIIIDSTEAIIDVVIIELKMMYLLIFL